MKNYQKVSIKNLVQHPYHNEVYKSRSNEYLEESIKRTGNEPIYPIVVVPNSDEEGMYWVIAGMNRLRSLILMDKLYVDALVYDTNDEKEIKDLIIDLNKQRVKDGYEHLMEFRHTLEMYPVQRGVPGNRYEKIGNELGYSKDYVKDLVMLNNFFDGDGQSVLESVFSGSGLTLNQANTLLKDVKEFPEKFGSESIYIKLCDKRFDFDRLYYAIQHLKLEDEYEFDIMKDYLLKNLTLSDFNDLLKKLGRVEKKVEEHDLSKQETPILDDVFETEHTQIVKGDNRFVEVDNKFGKKIQCLIGSCPYGDKRQNGDGITSETGHDMNGEEYGEYLANTYEKYIPHLESDGSIYVIIDDFKLDNGELSCSLEYFVVKMREKGFHLASRYTWIKNNPMPRSYNSKEMVNGTEMVYRFVLDPKNYYTNPDLYSEKDIPDAKMFKRQKGCTNQSKNGKTSNGGEYVQSHLKKLRNTLSEQDCVNAIKGNVANPEDFFRQAEEKKHTSTAP